MGTTVHHIAGIHFLSQGKIRYQKTAYHIHDSLIIKGRVRLTGSDEFSEKFQTAFDPPLIFGKLHCAFRDKIVTKVRMLLWRHCCVLYDPISHEMHVVQMFNMVIG